GLELHAHRGLVAGALLQQPELVLDVMTVFVRDDVALGERAALRAELRLQLIEEADVEIDLLVIRAIERTGGRAGRAARRLRVSGEEHGRGWVVRGGAPPVELVAPVPLHAVDEAHDAA